MLGVMSIVKDFGLEEMENKTLDYYRARGKLIHLEMSDDQIAKNTRRVSGEVVCIYCGKQNRDHPYIDNCLDHSNLDPSPFLHWLCNGTIAKL